MSTTSSPTSSSSFLGGVLAFLPAALLLVLAAGILLLWVYSPAKLPYAGWTMFLIVAGAVVFSFMSSRGSDGSNGSGGKKASSLLFLEPRALVALAVAAAIATALYRLGTGSAGFAASLATSYVGIVLGVLGLLVLLALGWLQFSRQLQQTTGVTGLLVHVLFALPCYLAMLAQYLADDFQNTAPATLLLLATEAVLLVLYRYRRPIASAASRAWRSVTGSGNYNDPVTTPLQTDKVFLNYETRLGNRPLPEGMDASGTGNRTHTMLTPARSLGQNQDYQVSLELYLHPIEVGGEPLAVMRYADGGFGGGGNGGGCPSIYFEGAGVPRRAAVDNLRNASQLQIFVTNRGDNSATDTSSPPPLLLPVPMQKWVALTFYYTRTQVDVFLDDRLVYSKVWTPENRPVFGPGDKFVLGHPMPNGGALGSLRHLVVTTPKPAAAE